VSEPKTHNMADSNSTEDATNSATISRMRAHGSLKQCQPME